MADHITLNGTVFGTGGSLKGPSNVEEELLTFGTEFEAYNGDMTLLQTGQKRQWTISWDNVTAATRNAVRALAGLTSAFTYIDEDGNSFTVQCPTQGRYQSGIGIIGHGGTLYYGVTLLIRQS